MFKIKFRPSSIPIHTPVWGLFAFLFLCSRAFSTKIPSKNAPFFSWYIVFFWEGLAVMRNAVL